MSFAPRLPPFLAGGVIYTLVPYRRLVPMLEALSWSQRCYAALLVPAIRLVGDVAKMIGYPAGWAWRLRHSPPKNKGTL